MQTSVATRTWKPDEFSTTKSFVYIEVWPRLSHARKDSAFRRDRKTARIEGRAIGAWEAASLKRRAAVVEGRTTFATRATTRAPLKSRARGAVGFVKQFQNVLDGLRLLQETDEPVVLKLVRDMFERPKVLAGTIRRRNEHEDEIDRLAVKAVEVDAFAADRNRADKTIDAFEKTFSEFGMPVRISGLGIDATDEVCRMIRRQIRAGDTILIKASHGMHYEKVVESIT